MLCLRRINELPPKQGRHYSREASSISELLRLPTGNGNTFLKPKLGQVVTAIIA